MPSSHRDLFPSVDEKKALEQLERFQREIQSARWKREHASAEFEQFVKGFGQEPASPTTPAEQPERAPAPSGHSVVRAMRRHNLATPPPRSSEQAQPPGAEAAPEETTSYSMRLQRWRGLALLAAAAAVLVLLAIGWWTSVPSSGMPAGSGAARPQPVAPARAPAPPPAARTRPEPAAAPAAQHAATLTTTRRVWVRVMADGHRLFEREIAAGESVPLDATQAIVIRAGDAGAVRLTFADGREETLGGEGQVVTKRYEIRN